MTFSVVGGFWFWCFDAGEEDRCIVCSPLPPGLQSPYNKRLARETMLRFNVAQNVLMRIPHGPLEPGVEILGPVESGGRLKDQGTYCQPASKPQGY